jgi:hypothetical protein
MDSESLKRARARANPMAGEKGFQALRDLPYSNKILNTVGYCPAR